MKIVIALIGVILIGGIGAGVVAYDHNTQANDETRESILETMNALKQLDSIANTVILASRFGLRTDYDALTEYVSNLRDTANRLKGGVFDEYAAENVEIKQSVKAFGEQLAVKIDLIESFKSHNAILRNSIKYAPLLGERLMTEAQRNGQDEAVKQLRIVNEALYRWALHNDHSEAAVIEQNAASILETHRSVDSNITLVRYSNHVSTVVAEQEATQGFVDKILAIDTPDTLAVMESLYLNHYVSIIQASEKSLYYVFFYAVFVLMIAIYLGVMLKKSYSRLKHRDDYRSQQLTVAHKHLVSANANVDTLKDSFVLVKETLRYLGTIHTEATKKQQDGRRLRMLLRETLRRYRSLEKGKVLDQTDEVLHRSHQNVERVSDLVKDLAVN